MGEWYYKRCCISTMEESNAVAIIAYRDERGQNGG